MARPIRFKNAIFESATKLFCERGLAGTGIREIAREAGVSEAALYRHWKGKKELAKDIFLRGMENMHAILQDRVPKDGPACESILAAVRTFYGAFDEYKDVTHYLLLNQHDLWRSFDRAEKNPVSFWFDLLRARESELQVSAELNGEILAPITLGMILRPAIAAAYGSLEAPLEKHAVAVSQAVCRVLGLPWIPIAGTP